MLDDAARFVTGRVAPLDASGDLDGCRFDSGDAPYDDPFRTDKRTVGAYFFDYPLAAFARRLALVEAGCRASLPVARAQNRPSA